MTQDELSGAYSARYSHHLQTMTGAMSAQVIDLLARLDTAHAQVADLTTENATLTTQRDEALHMQAETMKTVEQSGQEIERLKAELVEQSAAALTRYERLMAEHMDFFNRTQAENRERRNASRRKPKT